MEPNDRIAELEAARRMIDAEEGESLSDAIIRFGRRVAHGRCVCRWDSAGKQSDECEVHTILRKRLASAERVVEAARAFRHCECDTCVEHHGVARCERYKAVDAALTAHDRAKGAGK